jgi:hypothetical protein
MVNDVADDVASIICQDLPAMEGQMTTMPCEAMCSDSHGPHTLTQFKVSYSSRCQIRDRYQLWNGCGTVMERLWNGCGTVVKRSWNGRGMVVERLWNGCGTVVERSWNGCGMDMERMWNGCETVVKRLWNGCVTVM